MKKITPEIIKAAKEAKTCDELREMLNANGVEVSDEEVKKYFAQLKDGEISDEDLETVNAGGLCDGRFVTTESFNMNRKVEVINGKVCPFCRTNLGVTRVSDYVTSGSRNARYLEVRCEKCDAVILKNFRYKDVKFL